MAYNQLSNFEKRGWVFHAGLVYCTKCMITMRINAYQEEKDVQFQARVAQLVAEKYIKKPRPDSNLRKVESGKSWHKGSEFCAPYVQSPSVTKKLMRLARTPSNTATGKEPLSGGICTPMSADSLEETCSSFSNSHPLTESNIRLHEANTNAIRVDPDNLGRKQNEIWKGGKSSSTFTETEGDVIYCKVGKECVGEESSGETTNSTLLAALGSVMEGYDHRNYLDSDVYTQSSGSSVFDEDFDEQVMERKAQKSFGDEGRFSFMLDEGPEVESIDLSPLSEPSM